MESTSSKKGKEAEGRGEEGRAGEGRGVWAKAQGVPSRAKIGVKLRGLGELKETLPEQSEERAA